MDAPWVWYSDGTGYVRDFSFYRVYGGKRMTKVLTVSFPKSVEHDSPIVISDNVSLTPSDSHKAVVLRFTYKGPVNFENLLYFCGGYIDPRTRNYFASTYRIDAAYPLFTLDNVMPMDSPISAEDMMRMVTAFSLMDECAFEEEWHNPFTASFVAQQNCFSVFAATIDKIVERRMLLNKLRNVLVALADAQSIPPAVQFNYYNFLEHLSQAEAGLKAFMLHWTVLGMQDIYPKSVDKKLVSVLNFPLFEKIHGRLDYADRILLVELFEKQRDGSLEDDAFLLEDDED